MEEREKKVLKLAVINYMVEWKIFIFLPFCGNTLRQFAKMYRTGTRAKIGKNIFAVRIYVAMSRKL
jgi:hypothetical protein